VQSVVACKAIEVLYNDIARDRNGVSGASDRGTPSFDRTDLTKVGGGEA
jgi:hypothetical protein